MSQTDLSQNLRDHRVSLNLTQEQVAGEVGVHHSTISAMELEKIHIHKSVYEAVMAITPARAQEINLWRALSVKTPKGFKKRLELTGFTPVQMAKLLNIRTNTIYKSFENEKTLRYVKRVISELLQNSSVSHERGAVQTVDVLVKLPQDLLNDLTRRGLPVTDTLVSATSAYLRAL